MIPQTIVAPTLYPVSLAEAKAQLRIEHADFDARIAGYIAVATEWAEAYQRRALLTRTYRGFLDHWPRDIYGCVARYIDLPRPPAVSVAHVKTYDDADVATTFDPANYMVDVDSPIGRIVLRHNAVWPFDAFGPGYGAACTGALRAANGIEIEWTAGYGDNPGDVPEMTRNAILMMVVDLERNPSAQEIADSRVTVIANQTVTTLLDLNKNWRT